MTTNTTSALILGGTLAIGVVLGAIGWGTIAQQRRGPPPPPTDRGGGFVQHMSNLLSLTDEQQEAVRPFLLATDQRNREIIDGAEEDMRGALRQLSVDIAEFLDDDQREQLNRAVESSRPLRPAGPPGPGGQGRRGPPPDSRRPPPGR